MIRRLLRGVVRRALGEPPTPATPPPPRQEPEEPELPNLEVEGPELARWVAEGDVLLLDVREQVEVEGGFAAGSWLLPMNQVPDRLAELPRSGRVVVICAAGARSYGVAHYLREQGFAEAWSLAGGVGAYLDAGGQNVSTPGDAELRLLTPVRIRHEAADARGLDPALAGTVQRVDATPDGFRYSVRIRGDAATLVLEGLSAAELAPIGRR